MRRCTILLVVLLFAIPGCVNDSISEETLNGKVIQDEQLRAKIISAPNEITIEGIKYKTEALAWRNFAPSVPQYVGLISLNRLVRIDKNEIPSYLELEQQYVVNKRFIWIPEYDHNGRPNAIPHQKEKISRDGPEWELETEVNIGIKLFNKKTNEEYILLVPNKVIKPAY